MLIPDPTVPIQTLLFFVAYKLKIKLEDNIKEYEKERIRVDQKK